ncbi:MAG: hypothetical protein R3D27_06745 [Hyphomicrobiaceae bacterium]
MTDSNPRHPPSPDHEHPTADRWTRGAFTLRRMARWQVVAVSIVAVVAAIGLFYVAA